MEGERRGEIGRRRERGKERSVAVTLPQSPERKGRCGLRGVGLAVSGRWQRQMGQVLHVLIAASGKGCWTIKGERGDLSKERRYGWMDGLIPGSLVKGGDGI